MRARPTRTYSIGLPRTYESFGTPEGGAREEAAHKSNMATRLLQRIESADVNMTLTTLSRLQTS
jgi:hypothetical protein